MLPPMRPSPTMPICMVTSVVGASGGRGRAQYRRVHPSEVLSPVDQDVVGLGCTGGERGQHQARSVAAPMNGQDPRLARTDGRPVERLRAANLKDQCVTGFENVIREHEWHVDIEDISRYGRFVAVVSVAMRDVRHAEGDEQPFPTGLVIEERRHVTISRAG